MASSGDDLASYDQPPQANVRGASITTTGPFNKRKQALAPASNSDKRVDPVDSISISSDDKEDLPVTSRRGSGTTGSVGRSATSKGKSKVPAGTSARRRKKTTGNELGGVEEITAETEDDAVISRGTRPETSDGKGKNYEWLHTQLDRLQRKYDDVVHQRDNLSKQLDELFRLRQTEVEKLQLDQKSQYDARLRAHEDTIQELKNALSRADALSRSGGTTSLHFLTRETADEEKQDIQREVSSLRKIIKEKDAAIAEKDVKNHELSDTIQILRADLKTEIENTKALTSRNVHSSGSKHAAKVADAKHALVIRLYEELTGLLVTNVKHEPGQFKDDDAVYTCIQTTTNNKSLNFTLKFFQELEESNLLENGNANDRVIEKVIYTPLSLEKETKDFVAQLDFLASPFTFQKTQMNVFTKTLKKHLGEEDDDEQSDVSQMELEDD